MKNKNCMSEEEIDFFYDLSIFMCFATLALVLIGEVTVWA
jgi:hypothetical protein